MVDKAAALEKHKAKHGKIETIGKVPIDTIEELSTYYTPGVAFVSQEVKAHPEEVFTYTNKGNTLAIVTDGTRILGLGDIGPEAGLPVMEGKALLFKKFGGVDAVPICIKKSSEAEILTLLQQIEPSFGAINIEDIESPKSLRIVRDAAKLLQIPVFHDDQQGTAVVALAALMNSLKLAGKGKSARIVILGAGSAGIGISKLLHFAGFKNLYVLDSRGALYRGRQEGMNEFKEEIAQFSNPENLQGGLEQVIEGADVFIGVSGVPGAFSGSLVSKMAEKPIVLSLTNPVPEITYAEARAAGAFIAATGSSATPNQVNNSVAFPGISRGILEVRARHLTESMLYAAAHAISKTVGRNLNVERIMPRMTERKEAYKVSETVAAAIGAAAIKEGIAGLNKDPKEIRASTRALLKRYARIEKRMVSIEAKTKNKQDK